MQLQAIIDNVTKGTYRWHIFNKSSIMFSEVIAEVTMVVYRNFMASQKVHQTCIDLLKE